MLMDVMYDCKISHLEVHCSGYILCEVNLPKAIEFSKIGLFSKPFCPPWDGFGESFGDITGT